MIPDRIFLVGFIGTPKVPVGKALAARLERPFFDLEQLIEASARMPTREIFRKEGDHGYRQRERRSLVSVATGPPSVVATGAGTFVDRGNRRTMQLGGIAVNLDASLEECLTGAIEQGLIRPDDENNERFTALYEARAPEFDKAEVLVGEIHREPEVIADEIIQMLEERVWAEKFM